MTRRNGQASVKGPTVRCAIYTRKSSEDGLQQEFNSLDAQREAAEAFIASQKAEGWVALPDRYDDGGFTGGNTERPALQRLLADVSAGRIDCAVVYKVDRLSRSLLDFAKIMETFDTNNVSFVSVTQHFNTTHSMGRLTLNILLSFAQFEREIIGERIRDKIAASRQKGKWTGGTPVLGYDVDRTGGSPKLVVNPDEAERVRQIFELYLESGTLLAAVAELERRGWLSKIWSTRAGKQRGGEPYDKCRLHGLLTNVLYIGKTKHKKEIYAGEHEAIVPVELFNRVQSRLSQNRNGVSTETRNRHGALLRRLLYCKSCSRVMAHTYTTRDNKRYRYYTCTNAIKNGRRKCPTPSLPSAEIEKAVIDQIRCIGQDRDLVRVTLQHAVAQAKEALGRLERERGTIQRSVAKLRANLKELAVQDSSNGAATRISQFADQIEHAERRLNDVDDQIAALQRESLTEVDVTKALADFDNVWSALTPREQVRLINLLVHRVEFDVAECSIEISFHPTGIKAIGENESDKSDSEAEVTGGDARALTAIRPDSHRAPKRLRRPKEAAA